ncbi:MAG TPA: hypothetical protein VNK43_02920 [Gemmatimonadales bacterium]|nr:hypothetical protein [Gemmatimonadales bacterium]
MKTSRLAAPAALSCVLALGSALAPPAEAQSSFGQNKIQYRRFEWQVLRGPHVDLYYYPAEAHLAPAALEYAEASYDTLALQFGHAVPTRIPLIIYASHADFEQTNILPFTPPEGLLGVTDFLKRRVALPFKGNFAEFRHTLRHEMVHVFQLSLVADNYLRLPRVRGVALPLWWTEGLAELWSAGEDARDEMILRDLTLSGRLPSLRQLTHVTGGIVYPLGGRIHRFLADTYGDWRVAVLYKELWKYESFEAALQGVYGRTLDQLNDEFQLWMRRAYYPVAADRLPLPVAARRLVRTAIKPTRVAGSDDLLYVSPATGYVTIYRQDLDETDGARAVVESGRTPEMESFHPFDSRLDASRSPYLLFSTKYGERDALVIWDLDRDQLVGRYSFPELVSILSPAWAPDGRSIVFSGLSEGGLSDLYRLRLPGGELERITDDPYQDLDPSPSPDGRWVVFASDRTAGGIDGAINLFLEDLGTGEIRQLTAGPWRDEAPRWGADGRIYFTSSRDGVLNVFSVDTLGVGRRETSAWSGAFDGEYLPDRGALLVGGFHDLNWNVYYYPVDSVARADVFALGEPEPHGRWAWPVSERFASARVPRAPYRRRYSLDFAAADAVFVPGFGAAQGAVFFLSDLLSDNFMYFSLFSYQGRRLGSILKNINATGIYVNQTRRLNWGVGAFRAKGNNYEGDLDVAYEEETYGAIGLLRYPLSRYTRVEGTMVVERSDRTDFTLPTVEEPRRVGWIASHFVSFVHDNSLWLPTGPIDGDRVNLTAGLSSDFSNSRFDSFLLSGDYRKYFRLGRRSAYAVRLLGFYSGGDRPRRVNIGGTWALRGYPLYGYIVGSKAYMLNQELRFPLLNGILLATPVGDLPFPGVDAAVFADLGRAWFTRSEGRSLLGSYGLSFRMPLTPIAVLRLDWGWRFSDDDFEGYSLRDEHKRSRFVSFFFGYNY